MREDELLVQLTRLIRREDGHAQPGPERGRVGVPVEGGFGGTPFREPLHPFEGFLVQDEGEVERFGDGLVRDVVVSAKLSICKGKKKGKKKNEK